MQYEGREITAMAHTRGTWRMRLVAADGRPLKGDDRQRLESVTSATAVDALTLAMEAVDAAGLFFRNGDRAVERFWRVFLRTVETPGAHPAVKKKPRRRRMSESKSTHILGKEEIIG